MRYCHRCEQPITGEAEEITPPSVSGARPTLWRHKMLADCGKTATAPTATRASPLRRHLGT